MKDKEKKTIILLITAGILFSIAAGILIFIFSHESTPSASENPSQPVTNTSSEAPVNSPIPTQEYTPKEGLNEHLPNPDNPYTVILEASEVKLIDNTASDDAYAVVYFPDISIANYENDKFILNTGVFHEKNNYIGIATIISGNFVKSGYLLSDRDETVYMSKIEKNTVQDDVSLKIINRDNPITQQEADSITGLVQLTDPDYVLDNRDDLFILNHVKEALEKLLLAADAYDASLNMHVASAHRTFDAQKQSFDYWVNRRVAEENMTYTQAYEYTAGRVAIPGCSEHHNGLTLDVIGYGYMLDESSKGAPYALWLKDNSYKYGFTIRYEEGKQQYTKITLYEPWHIRYVGLPTAYYLYREDLCMEQFYIKLLNEKYIEFMYDNETYYYIYSKTDNIYIDTDIMEIIQYSAIASGVDGYVLLCKSK